MVDIPSSTTTTPSGQGAPQRDARPLSVVMLGTRGCPDIQGGVERHIEELAPRLAALGCRVEVVARRSYLPPDAPRKWRNVKIVPLPCPREKAIEAIFHTALGVFYAAWKRPDVVHIHAIGPSLLVPLARLLGLRVTVTHHGFDYERAKWGFFARAMLRAGEWCGMNFASAVIGVSEAITERMRKRFRRSVTAIPNGVTCREPPITSAALERFGLDRSRYVVMVARIVPEKRQRDLIDAFAKAAVPGWKLLLVGAADHEDSHAQRLRERAAEVPNVVMAGFQSGMALRELIAHAGLFVLPSSHEGLPIALLEALSYGLPVLASDIPANREVGLSEEVYFPVGDVDRLAALITEACAKPVDAEQRETTRARVARDYDWERIAIKTLDVYRGTLPETTLARAMRAVRDAIPH